MFDWPDVTIFLFTPARQNFYYLSDVEHKFQMSAFHNVAFLPSGAIVLRTFLFHDDKRNGRQNTSGNIKNVFGTKRMEYWMRATAGSNVPEFF